MNGARAVLLLPLLAAGGADRVAAAGALRVPDGFVIETAASPPAVVFPMFAALDDRGRLFVAESSGLDLYAELRALTRKCRVSLLEDHDGDGRFESSRVFAEKLVYPMGLAWRAGKLYVADPPDLVVLADTDGDGAADRRDVVLSGFGHTDNGSLHGLTFGPDGLLYMTMGSPDGYRLRRDDGSMLEGESGVLLRSRPDGSRLEVIARGFENLVEVEFLPSGDIIGTDNWFQLPQAGERDALVHLADGGLYPLHAEKGTPQPVTGPRLGPVALFPAVALSGMVRYRGAAFPAAMHGSLFTAQHNARKVGRHVLVRDGATFRCESFDFVTTDDPDFHPADVLEAADGSLLVVDTGGWYVKHCPTGRIRDSRAEGGIYRVRHGGAAPAPDPWGLAIAWSKAGASGLAGLLGDPRPAVRARAQAELAGRGDEAVAAIRAALARNPPPAAKEHAVWTLAAIDGAAARGALLALLGAGDLEIVPLACRALAQALDRQAGQEPRARGDREASGALSRLLAHERAEVRFAAAEALARSGAAAAAGPLAVALTRDPDRFLEHALVHALYRLASIEDLERALEHSHPRVQKAALLLLDQPPRSRLPTSAVVARLASPDTELRRTAVEILARRPDGAAAAAALARRALEREKPGEEERFLLRGLVAAFARDPAMQELVEDALVGDARDAAWPLFLLDLIATAGVEDLPPPWEEALRALLRQGSAAARPGAERAAAVRAAAVFPSRSLDAVLVRVAEDSGEERAVRLEALRATAPRLQELAPACFELIVAALAGGEEPLLRLAAAEAAARAPLTAPQLEAFLRAALDDPLIAPDLVLQAIDGALARGEARAAGPAVAYLERALRGGFRPREEDLRRTLARLPAGASDGSGALLDLLRRSEEGQRERLRSLEPLLAGGSAGRGREVFSGKKAGCSACHRIGAAGGLVGPDLTRVGAVRSGRDVLESIVFPSSTFAQGYETYAVLTRDGEAAAGVIARQTPAVLVLRTASGAEVQVRKDGIASMERQDLSLMPEGLDRALGAEDLRDLLAYLLSLR